MNNKQQERPPLTRSIVFIALGVGICAWLLATQRPGSSPRRSVPAGDEPVSVKETAAAVPEPAATTPPNPRPAFGTLTERPETARTPDSPLKDMKLAFKLDPRITRSLYSGDRWVSPRTFTRAGVGLECKLQAKAQGVDTKGRPVPVDAEWTVADRSIATISPGERNTIEITVHRPGKTTLEVAAFGLSKKLPLNALPDGDGIIVEVYLQ